MATLYYLPAYSPELNRTEAAFKQIKRHEMPTTSSTSKADLSAAGSRLEQPRQVGRWEVAGERLAWE